MHTSKLMFLFPDTVRFLSLIITIFALLPSASLAAVIETALIGAQPQMIMKDGRANMCGLRLVVLPQTFQDDSREGRLSLDTSLVMGRDGLVGVKGLGLRSTPDGLKRGEFKKIRLASLWIKPDGSRATVAADGKTFAGDDGIALLYTDKEFYSVYIKLLEAVTKKRSITIGFRLNPNSDERIASGIVEIGDDDLAAFIKCNQELSE
jgi:hypothetical protein